MLVCPLLDGQVFGVDSSDASPVMYSPYNNTLQLSLSPHTDSYCYCSHLKIDARDYSVKVTKVFVKLPAVSKVSLILIKL